MRKFVYKLRKSIGLKGGILVFHPYRIEKGEWSYTPHFHSLAYGWVIKTAETYQESGWIVRNHGYRKNVFGMSKYILSHAGIKKGYQSVTWFGELGNSVLKVSRREELEESTEFKKCPYCGSPLVLLEYTLDRPPDIEEDFEGLIKINGWEISVGEYSLGRTGLDVDSYREIIKDRYYNKPIELVIRKEAGMS